MSKSWTNVPIREVLRHDNDVVEINASDSYRIAGVYSFGKGLLAREPILGTQTTYKVFHRLHKDDFVLSQLKAWEGALARVSASFEGWFLSPQFQTFRAIPNVLDIFYLEWYFKQSKVWEELRDKSQGMGARRDSVSSNRFLSLTIPLPPLEEQRRIVARIEALAAKIAEARGLRRETEEEIDQILTEAEFNVWPDKSLEDADVLERVTAYLARGKQSVQGESEHFLIKTQHVQMKNYIRSNMTLASYVADLVAPEAIVQTGDILIACSAAGCLGRVAQFTEVEQLASTDTHVAIARADTTKVLPEYLYAYLRGAQGQVQLRSRERGDWTREKVGFRFTELNLADLRRVPVPLPPLEEQRRIVAHLDALQARVDALKHIQAESSAELNALLPSILDKAFKGEL